jgi:polysaccharide export outer membrane protein
MAVAAAAGVMGQVSLPSGQQRPTASAPSVPGSPAPAPAPAAAPPADYRIGPDDVLTITFWRQQDLSGDVVVRPDGKISLPLLNDVQAAGLTPIQLREVVMAGAKRFVEDPNATIVVKQINSRRVFITGAINKPGPYSLTVPTTVLQLIAMAGGLLEYADKDNVVIVRTDQGRQQTLRFNYKDVVRRKNLDQNIELRPGDTVIVP